MHRIAEAGGATNRIDLAMTELSPGRYLLAVSGGRDSMVLMDAAARVRGDIVAVATFDHGTGPAARNAAALVHAEAERRGLAAVMGTRESGGASTEAAWRAARRKFLAGWARELRATVVTAHTRDDQLETVVLRLLRDSRVTGARGLAAMYARSPVARPLLDVARADVSAYAVARSVRYLDDPSNATRAHLRNRVRLDLLPALESVAPGFGAAMLDIARRAALLREAVETVVDQLGLVGEADRPTTDNGNRSIAIPAPAIAGLGPEALALVWPAIAARAGVTLDWRGVERLVAFTPQAKVGGRVPLSGGGVVERTQTTFVVRPSGRYDRLY
jgi:tRNA(Ile)-lysidine synthase